MISRYRRSKVKYLVLIFFLALSRQSPHSPVSHSPSSIPPYSKMNLMILYLWLLFLSCDQCSTFQTLFSYSFVQYPSHLSALFSRFLITDEVTSVSFHNILLFTMLSLVILRHLKYKNLTVLNLLNFSVSSWISFAYERILLIMLWNIHFFNFLGYLFIL